jgi:hypothetical protein
LNKGSLCMLVPSWLQGKWPAGEITK